MKFYYLCFMLILALALLSFGCATNYNNVPLNSMGYTATNTEDSVAVSCILNPLLMSGNFRYYKYVTRHNMSILAVKVKNNTNQPIQIDAGNLAIKDGIEDMPIVDLPTISKSIHQPGVLYLLWGLLWFTISKSETDSEGNITQSSYIPIPIGLIIGLGNMATSFNSDKKFREQMTKENLIGKTVKPNEEINGFVGVLGVFKNSVRVQYIQ